MIICSNRYSSWTIISGHWYTVKKLDTILWTASTNWSIKYDKANGAFALKSALYSVQSIHELFLYYVINVTF